MKKTNYSIQIDNPCEENWNTMTKTDKGKFCAMCEKNVIDFSKLTDNEILKIIESNTNGNKNLCGRFTKTQLNRVLIDTNPQTNPKLYQLLAGLLLFSTATNANAENGKPKIENFETETRNPIILENDTLPKNKNQTDFTITGKITDTKKEAIPGANIFLKSNKQVATISNDNGEFSLNIPSHLVEGTITLIIEAAIFVEATFMICKKDIESRKVFSIELKEDTDLEQITISAGMIYFKDLKPKSRKWWQFWKRRR